VTGPWFLGAAPLATRRLLVRVRIATAIVDLCVLAGVWAFETADLPLRRAWPLIALSLVANIGVVHTLRNRSSVPRSLMAAALAIDILLLTALLDLTGGPSNPFLVAYAVYIALAAVTVGAGATWGLGAFALACYGVLVYWHLNEAAEEHHHRLNDLPTHLFTVWVVVAAAAELCAYLVGRASDALQAREHELEEMRARAVRADRLIALTTLAAGAAHELSTPLATIAVSARELELSAASIDGGGGAAEDARLIRQEVDRCQAILDQMSGRAGGIATAAPESFDVARALDEMRGRLPPPRREQLEITIDAPVHTVHLPRAGFGQALGSLVANALDASGTSDCVRVVVHGDTARLRVEVHDHGSGMQPDVLERAGEPFFTTKEPGRGMGLGLFLARLFAERLGGSLTLTSDRGTIAVLELPVRATTETV